jgi:glyoxylase-like metal-dependent hydrolase (beta-lactamase superfamily II)
MQITELAPDIILLRGETYQSIATALLDGRNVLLVDTLGSAADAEQMRGILERGGRQVRLIVMSHYMSDHLAGVRLFPSARVVAHRFYSQTYLGQRDRGTEADSQFVAPSITFDGSIEFEWGRHRVKLLHNPGKTLCALAVDVPTNDMVLCGDAIVGNTVYFSGNAAPDLLAESLRRLRALGRSTVVPGHIGAFAGTVLANAQHYLESIDARVRDLRSGCAGDELEERIRTIDIDECLVPGVVASAFEREWHGHNLERIVERRLFFGACP